MKKKQQKLYLAGIPIPYLDQAGRRLSPSKVEKWSQLALRELTECFGGATIVPAPGTNIVQGRVLYERGQKLVLSACDNRNKFLGKRKRIRLFVEEMATALNQEAVFVLGFRSDSFLIEFGKKDLDNEKDKG